MSTSLAAMQGLGIAQFNLGTNPSSDSDLNELLRDEDMSYNRLSGIMRELRNGSRPKADILQQTLAFGFLFVKNNLIMLHSDK